MMTFDPKDESRDLRLVSLLAACALHDDALRTPTVPRPRRHRPLPPARDVAELAAHVLVSLLQARLRPR